MSQPASRSAGLTRSIHDRVLGGVLGGWLGQSVGPAAVSRFCAVLALVWLALASSMNPPPLRVAPAAAPR